MTPEGPQREMLVARLQQARNNRSEKVQVAAGYTGLTIALIAATAIDGFHAIPEMVATQQDLASDMVVLLALVMSTIASFVAMENRLDQMAESGRRVFELEQELGTLDQNQQPPTNGLRRE